MNKLYNGPTWHNNTNPALNETNLNILGQTVDDIDDRVIAIAGTVMETVPQVQEDLAEAQELLEDAEAINSHPPIIGQNGNWWTWDTSTNAYVDSGKDASVTVSVNPNTETLPAGSNAYVRNVGTSTDPVLLFGIPKGDKGETGGATPESDISGTVVDTITASTAEYPEIAASDTMKVITGKIKKFLDDLKTKKADKVTSATNGHLAGLDSNGNLTDSGKSSSAVLPSGGTTGQVLKKSSGTDYAVEWDTASSGGHTILNSSGTTMTARGKLQFDGLNVSDDSGNDKTVVTAPTPDYVDEQYSSSKTYSKGMTCISGNKRYRYINSTVSSGHQPPNATYWEVLSVDDEIHESAEIIASFTGTTSLIDGRQRLATQQINKTLSQIQSYRYLIIEFLYYSLGVYIPYHSACAVTDSISTSNAYLSEWSRDWVANADCAIQLTMTHSNTSVEFQIRDSSSTTYQRGWVIYGIK